MVFISKLQKKINNHFCRQITTRTCQLTKTTLTPAHPSQEKTTIPFPSPAQLQQNPPHRQTQTHPQAPSDHPRLLQPPAHPGQGHGAVAGLDAPGPVPRMRGTDLRQWRHSFGVVAFRGADRVESERAGWHRAWAGLRRRRGGGEGWRGREEPSCQLRGSFEVCQREAEL